MLITEKSALEKYFSPYRVWQGIPAIEITKGGRIFSAFYSGGTKEEIDNFSVVVKSDDGGDSFSEPILAVFKKGHRCYDPCLWIDPYDRLWFIFALAPHHAVYATVCEEPDADTVVFGAPFKIGEEVMMNKPCVLSSGEWLFPIAVWRSDNLTVPGGFISDKTGDDRRAFAYVTCDGGKSFERLGGAAADQRTYDEHMLLELSDGRIAMYIRTAYGIAVCYSRDGGKSFSEPTDSGLSGPNSRFFISKLKSGRILLINHYKYSGRSHLTAMLSEDDGASFPYKLLLDERSNVSYPDAKEADDGFIYITYDRERGGFKSSLDEVYDCAREILYARITEEDIIRGEVGEDSKLRQIVSRLGKYEGDDPFANEV